MNCKRKGSKNEHRSIRLLEAAGYACTRAAASLGAWDIIGIGSTDFVAMQVKTRNWPGATEMETLKLFPVSPNCRKLIHRFGRSQTHIGCERVINYARREPGNRQRKECTMKMDEFMRILDELSSETGIPVQQLLNMTGSEIEPILNFAALKGKLQVAKTQAEIGKLQARLEGMRDKYPLWRKKRMNDSIPPKTI